MLFVYYAGRSVIRSGMSSPILNKFLENVTKLSFKLFVKLTTANQPIKSFIESALFLL